MTAGHHGRERLRHPVAVYFRRPRATTGATRLRNRVVVSVRPGAHRRVRHGLRNKLVSRSENRPVWPGMVNLESSFLRRGGAGVMGSAAEWPLGAAEQPILRRRTFARQRQ